MSNPDISVIIVNYNSKELTEDCIKSIKKFTSKINYEIIVVDNASTDGSVEMLRKLKTKNLKLKTIFNRENSGFAAGNNKGAKIASGRYLLFLNSDTKFTESVLGPLISWMDKNKNVGVATCALKNKDGTLQGSGGYFPNLFRVVCWMFFLEDIPFLQPIIKPFHPIHSRAFWEKGTKQFTKKREQDWVTGAFFLTRKEVFDQLDGFDEDYFMYTEEVDFCFKVKKAGWKVFYNPTWSVIHYGGASSPKEFPIISEFSSIKIFYKKHYPLWQLMVLRIVLKGGVLLRIITYEILAKKELVKVYAKALEKI